MPLSRSHITYLFHQYLERIPYDESLSQMQALDIRTSYLMLSRSSEAEYVPVLCDIIRSHIHWRIAVFFNTVPTPPRPQTSADTVGQTAKKVTELTLSAAHTGFSIASHVFAGANKFIREHGISKMPLHTAARKSFLHPAQMEGTVVVDPSDDVVLADAAEDTLMIKHEDGLDSRILLFNHIMEYALTDESEFFHSELMTTHFCKMLVSLYLLVKSNREFVYTRLFFPPLMAHFLESDFRKRCEGRARMRPVL